RRLRKWFPKTEKGERAAGRLMAFLLPFLTLIVVFDFLWLCYEVTPWLYLVMQSLLCWQCLAMKDLASESTKVQKALEAGDLEKARKQVSRIVGRDTEELTAGGVTRAAVETVAENFSDGVVAPLLCMLVGGAPLALTYKAINTMDSMVGYKNEKYVNFGRGAAKLDDVANWIPSRISAFLWMAAAGLTGNSAKGAFRIWKRDRRKHASPNAGQTEAACAGSLGVRLAGPISYFGEPVEKEYIGDKERKITPKDIGKANRMMFVGSVLCLLIGLAIRFAVCYYNDWIMI
ncbi:MAG: cobalamin biosynthesis protein CobD, partial [Clostridia bacterium]|nr:cobalamin biosynthesis protein CobD [Clostridia bacterium]